MNDISKTIVLLCFFVLFIRVCSSLIFNVKFNYLHTKIIFAILFINVLIWAWYGLKAMKSKKG